MSLQFDFTDVRVYVVGGTSGINLGIADAFAASGARVAVAGRNEEKLERAVKQLQKHGGEVLGVSLDVRDAERVIQGWRSVADSFTAVDVLVSGAAGNFPARPTGMSSNGFKAVVDIDLVGTFNVIRHGFEVLVKPGASVINISAPQSLMPMHLQSHVCAAKAGVDMLTRSFALEWGVHGIRVNSIVPGPIEGTEGMSRLAPNDELNELVNQTVPMGRQGTLDDISNAAMFLSSPQSAYISGAVLPVDGAWSLYGAARVMEGLADSGLIANV